MNLRTDIGEVSEAKLAEMIGCDRVVVESFDHGGQLGVSATFGLVRHAHRFPTAGELEITSQTLGDIVTYFRDWKKSD